MDRIKKMRYEWRWDNSPSKSHLKKKTITCKSTDSIQSIGSQRTAKFNMYTKIYNMNQGTHNYKCKTIQSGKLTVFSMFS